SRPAGDRCARAARARDCPHRRRRAHPARRVAHPAGRAGRPPRDRDALSSRGALAQGARDPEGGGFLEGAQLARWDRRVGGERGPEVAALLGRLTDQDAEGGTRTPTGLRPLAPEASASTSSTTSARGAERRI